MSVIKKLKEYVENKQVTAYEIFQETGIDQSVLSRILSGKTKKPQKETELLLASYLQNKGELQPIQANNFIRIPVISRSSDSLEFEKILSGE